MSVCLCHVLWVCVTNDVRSGGPPEAAEADSFAKGSLPMKESAPLPAKTLVHTLQMTDKCGFDQIREGELGLLEKPFGSVVHGSLV